MHKPFLISFITILSILFSINNSHGQISQPQKPFIKNISLVNGYYFIEWISNIDSNLKGYNLYSRKTDDSLSEFKQVNIKTLSSSVNSYTDKWASKDFGYTYYLVAIDSLGNKSEPSDFFNTPSPIPSSITSKIRSLNIKQKNKNIQLKWEIEKTPIFMGCVVYCSSETEPMKPISGIISENTFTYTPTDSIHVKYFMIRSFDNGGKKSDSETIRFETKQ